MAVAGSKADDKGTGSEVNWCRGCCHSSKSSELIPDLELGNFACTGDWDSHGGRRRPWPCLEDGHRPGFWADRCGPADRGGRRTPACPSAGELFAPTLRGADERSVDVHGCVAPVGRRIDSGVLSSSTPRIAHQSYGCV